MSLSWKVICGFGGLRLQEFLQMYDNAGELCCILALNVGKPKNFHLHSFLSSKNFLNNSN